MANEPMISVILPYYKGEDYIDQCVGSLISQTEKRIEILIIFDEQDPNAESVFKTKDWPSCVKTFKRKGSGPARRNIGIELAQGKYIFFMDQDDFMIRDDAFEKMLKGAEDNDADLVNAEFDRFDGQKFTFGCRLRPNGPSELSGEDSMEIFFDRGSIWTVMWNVLFKREFVGETRFEENLYWAEDSQFMFEIQRKLPKIHLERGLVSYAYRVGGGLCLFSDNLKLKLRENQGLAPQA